MKYVYNIFVKKKSNSKRIAETWLGDYKAMFYKERSKALEVEVGSIKEMQAVQKNLQCRSFRWYLQNVFRELE